MKSFKVSWTVYSFFFNVDLPFSRTVEARTELQAIDVINRTNAAANGITAEEIA